MKRFNESDINRRVRTVQGVVGTITKITPDRKLAQFLPLGLPAPLIGYPVFRDEIAEFLPEIGQNHP